MLSSFVVEELFHRVGHGPDGLRDVVHVDVEPLESRNLNMSQHFLNENKFESVFLNVKETFLSKAIFQATI